MCAENNVMTGKNNMLVPIKDIMPIISVGYKNSPAHKTATSMLLGFTPVVGDIKDFQEAITGYDIVAGEKLTVASRGVTLVAAFIPIANGKSLRVTYDVAKIKSTKSLKALNKKFGVKIPSKLLDEGASGAKASNVDDILNSAVENTTQKGVAKNYVKSGGYDAALKDFESLNLNNVKDIQTKYGPGKVGYTSDGATVVVRSGSSAISEGAPTLEIKISNSNISKVRY